MDLKRATTSESCPYYAHDGDDAAGARDRDVPGRALIRRAGGPRPHQLRGLASRPRGRATGAGGARRVACLVERGLAEGALAVGFGVEYTPGRSRTLQQAIVLVPPPPLPPFPLTRPWPTLRAAAPPPTNTCR